MLRGNVAATESAFVANRMKAPATPASRAEAYFEIAALVDRFRGRARDRGVTVGPDAMQFGFAAYAKEAPDATTLGRVKRQQQVACVVVDALLESAPGEIGSVRREAGGSRGSQKGRIEAADYFTPDARWSVAVQGAVVTTALRVSFTGRTPTLRNFLNRLAGTAVLVRTVEVEPAADGGHGEWKTPPSPTAGSVVLRENTEAVEPAEVAKLMVSRRSSRFTVTVEYAELEPAPATVGAAPRIAPTQWRPPSHQSRGAEWVFDLFTPPEMVFDARQNRFSIPSTTEADTNMPDEPFGLALLSVRRELFRLQLLGEVGHGGKRRGIFEHRPTGEVYLAGPGQAVPRHRIDVTRIEERHLSPDNGMPLRRLVAAVVDGESHREIELVAGEDGVSDTLTATVKPDAGDARRVGIGEIVEVGTVSYRIDAMVEHPASVSVTKASSGSGRTEYRVLALQEDAK
jgi:hypothetical protein